MSEIINNVKISLRKDDLSNWIRIDPVLQNGEIAIAVDLDGNENIKIGNGLSSFSQLSFLNQNVLKSDLVQAGGITAKYISQGYSNRSAPTSFATGVFTEADGNFGVVHGIEAKIISSDDYAFVFNGENLPGITERYTSHGEGTFNVNPLSGLNGFYIGEQTLSSIFNNYFISSEISNYYNKTQVNGLWLDLDNKIIVVDNKLSDYYKKSETSSSVEIQSALNSKVKVGKYENDQYLLSSQDLSIVNIAADDYYKMVAEEKVDKNVVYILSSDNLNAHGQTIINVANPILSNDAATKAYVDSSISGMDLTEYYKKNETSSSLEISGAFAKKADLSALDNIRLSESITWAELTAKAQVSSLVPGKCYRITDYVTKVSQEDCRSKEHQFDLIVKAISESKLDENAKATIHEGDTYFPAHQYGISEYAPYLTYERVSIEAWDIKYCLYNDTKRFFFADTENGKGVIWWMKDEWDNEAYYDFKNVQFWDSNDGVWRYTFDGTDYEEKGLSESYDFSNDCLMVTDSVRSLFGNIRIGRVNECFGNKIEQRADNTDSYSISLNILPKNIFKCALTQIPIQEYSFLKYGGCFNNVLGNGCYSNTFGNYCYSNTFGYGCNSNTFGDYCYSNTFGDNCYSNTFGDYCNSNTFGNICYNNTFGDYCNSNTFGYGCNSNTFGDDYNSNTFGDYCNSNTFGDCCNSNTFGDYCYSNTFGDNCYSNTFGDYCNSNTFGNICYSNTFGDYCNSNTFGDYCYSNTFGDNYNSNTFGDYCYSNTFGDYCNSNTFGDYCYSNTFGDSCNSNTFGDYCKSNTFGNNCSFNRFSTKYNNDYIYIRVENFIQNQTFSNLGITSSSPTNQYVGKNSNGTVVKKNPFDDYLLSSNLSFNYDSSSKYIHLKAFGNDIGTVNCADFIKDGMLSSACLCGNVFVLTFNTDAGKTPISVNLSNFVDNYLRGSVKTLKCGEISISADNTGTAELSALFTSENTSLMSTINGVVGTPNATLAAALLGE